MTTKRGRPAGAKNTPADEQIRKDILKVYRRLGGVVWLESWVKADPKNATEFVKQGLAKVLAQPMLRAIEQQQPEDAPALSEFEAARRVAFALSLALHDAGEPLTVEGEVIEQAKPPADWQPPSWMPPPDQERLPFEPAVEPDAVEQVEPSEAPDPTPAVPGGDTRAMALTGGDNNQYAGSPGEQGSERRERVVQRKETVVEKLRRQRGGR